MFEVLFNSFDNLQYLYLYVIFFFSCFLEMINYMYPLLYHHLSSRAGVTPSLSIIFSGIQYVGLIGFKTESASKSEMAARPNKV